MIVVIKPRAFGFVRQPQIFRGDVADRLQCVSSHENVGPAIVVIIKEPGRETEDRLGHARSFGYIGKMPRALWILVRAARSIISKEHVGLAPAREVEVGQPISVEVRRRDSFHERQMVHARFSSAFGEGAVAIVAVKFAPMRCGWFCSFVADEKIEPAVVVVIEPDGGLGRVKAEQPRFLGDIIECPIAVVAQKRVGMATAFPTPGAAQNQDIRKTIIVVISLHDVESADLAEQTGLRRAVGEGPISIVVEKTKLLLHVPA